MPRHRPEGAGRGSVRYLLPTAVVFALLLAPPAAHGADTFVDQATGADTNNCLQATNGGAGVGPCLTIGAAVPKTGAGDTVFVVDPAVQTTYPESVTLLAGKSLVALSADNTETIIDNGTGMGTTPAVSVLSVGGGSVEGFTIRSNFLGLQAQVPVTVQDNVFDEDTPTTSILNSQVQLDSDSAGSLFTENVLSDPTPMAGQQQRGLFVGGASTISDNSFDDFPQAIAAGGSPTSTPTIEGNEITGTRIGVGGAVGIHVTAGNPTIVDNRIDDPFFAAPGDVISGIVLNDGGNTISGATLQRNVIIGHRTGVRLEDTPGPVTLEGDLIVQSRAAGLFLRDLGPDDPGLADATATNVTIVDTDDPTVATEDEIFLENANLTLDSSIVGDKGIDLFGPSLCSLSFSRGPTTSGTSCQTFQTSADPMFIDYHLSVTSGPLIDTGNPAAPTATLDIDGGPRLVDGNADCAPRRDMGADEFVPASAACTPPPTLTPTPTPTVTPTPTTPRKKCKKGRKLKKGKCVKKKRKRR